MSVDAHNVVATPRDGLSCRAAFDELLALDTAEERAHSPDHQPLS